MSIRFNNWENVVATPFRRIQRASFDNIKINYEKPTASQLKCLLRYLARSCLTPTLACIGCTSTGIPIKDSMCDSHRVENRTSAAGPPTMGVAPTSDSASAFTRLAYFFEILITTPSAADDASKKYRRANGRVQWQDNSPRLIGPLICQPIEESPRCLFILIFN